MNVYATSNSRLCNTTNTAYAIYLTLQTLQHLMRNIDSYNNIDFEMGLCILMRKLVPMEHGCKWSHLSAG